MSLSGCSQLDFIWRIIGIFPLCALLITLIFMSRFMDYPFEIPHFLCAHIHTGMASAVTGRQTVLVQPNKTSRFYVKLGHVTQRQVILDMHLLPLHWISFSEWAYMDNLFSDFPEADRMTVCAGSPTPCCKRRILVLSRRCFHESFTRYEATTPWLRACLSRLEGSSSSSNIFYLALLPPPCSLFYWILLMSFSTMFSSLLP